ncbi:MAG: KDO2-lipid IV(A) lauroyltransferase [Planctomycetota bacterium]|jgi:KDO2-lipid IV(A) lauroyltransferase
MTHPTSPNGEPLRRRVRARLLQGLARSAAVLPESLMRSGLGLLARLLVRGRYGEQTRANLRFIYGDKMNATEVKTTARAVFAHNARLLAEWLRLANGAAPDSSSGAWIEQRVRIDDSIIRLEEALAAGRGAIIVTAHIGNWELLAAALRRRGMRGRVIGFQRERDSSGDWLLRMRRAYGVETLAQDTNAREAMKVLRRGEILGILCDLEARRLDGRFLPFLGKQAFVMTAPAALARATRSPLFPISCMLEPKRAGQPQHYCLRVEGALEFDRTLPREEATLNLLQNMNAVFEGWIRQYPEQWAWHQPRWRLQSDSGRTSEADATPAPAERL